MPRTSVARGTPSRAGTEALPDRALEENSVASPLGFLVFAVFRIARNRRNRTLGPVTQSSQGRTFPDASRMNRLIRLVLELMPRELRDLTRAAGLDVEATCRLQPLAELLALARKHRGWSSVQAAKCTGVRRRTIDAAESANSARIDAGELIAYTSRLGTLHLLGEWVAANPRLAKSMGLPDESEVLVRGRLVITEDARQVNLLPDPLRAAIHRRFEAPPDFSQHLDPDRAEERLSAFLSQTGTKEPPLQGGGLGSLLGGGLDDHALRLPNQPAAPALYEFRVSLKHLHPPVWRTFVVPNDLTFDQLHSVLQIVMGWSNSHLHSFRWRDLEIGVPDPEWNHPLLDGTEVRIAELGLRKRSKLVYAYDFGDDWIHDLVVERVLPYQENFLPVCLAGARSCPPEDCGGPHAYPGFIQAATDPSHPDHEFTQDWVGTAWNPESFDPKAINLGLAKLAARWKRGSRRRKKS